MGLITSLADEQVSQLALREPILASPDEPVRAAVTRMRDLGLGCVFVVDDERRPIGVFTEAMLTQLLVHHPTGLDDKLAVRMSHRVLSVATTDPASRVLESMQLENTRFLCVVDAEGRVAGLTGQKGLMEFIAEHFPQHVMVQRVGSPAPQQREGA